MEAVPLEALAPASREALARAASRPFHAPLYMDAFAAAGARIFVLSDPELGHAWALEHDTMGFRTWVAPCEPALAPGADPAALWAALLAAVRAQGALAIAWREASLVRLRAEHVGAASKAAAAMGAEAVGGQLATRVVPLADEAAMWSALEGRHRNRIRKAQAAGARVERGDDGFVAQYAALSDATFARSGLPGPARPYLERVAAASWARCYQARDAAGAVVAGAIVAVEGTRATYLHGAGVRAVDGAGELLQWEIMRELTASGVREYDMGGIALPGTPGDTPKAAGIRQFKERFGGALELWPSLQVRVDPAAYRDAQQKVRAAAAPR